MKKTNKQKAMEWKRFYKNFGLFVWLLIGSFVFIFISIYSYGKVNPTKAQTEITNIDNIEFHKVRYIKGQRKSWIIFTSTNGQSFYIRTDQLSVDSNELVEELKRKAQIGAFSVSYTNRVDLCPGNLPHFLGHKRAVDIRQNDHSILSLDEYNQSNRGFFIIWMILGVLGVLSNLATIFFLDNNKYVINLIKSFHK